MNARHIELLRRRERLLMRAEMQRNELAGLVQTWQTPIRVVDGGLEVVRTLRAHPLLWVAPVALLVALRPRRALRWSGKAWTVWRLWRRWQTSALGKWMRDAA